MIAKPPHNRKLGLLGVALTKARNNRFSGQASKSVRDELETLMIESRYLDDAPFSWVTIALRYGLKNDDRPTYQRINRRYGDLPLAIELDTHELMGASLDQLTKIFKVAVLKALIDAGRRYNRPIDALQNELNRMAHP